MEETKNLHAIMILEIIGKPAEHLTTTLEELAKKIDEEKDVTIINKKINEPTLMKDSKDFYVSFMEVEIKTKGIMELVMLMFKYMPAYIEIVEPNLIALSNNNWSEILSELVRKLHGYDEVARIMQMEKGILEKKLRELLPKKEEGKVEEKDEEKNNAPKGSD